MPIKNSALTACIYVEAAATNLPVTGDAANITVRGVGDGVEFTPSAPNITEIDATNLKGVYSVALTAGENNYKAVLLGGKSTTAGVIIKPIQWFNESDANLTAINGGTTGSTAGVLEVKGLKADATGAGIPAIRAVADASGPAVSIDGTATDAQGVVVEGKLEALLVKSETRYAADYQGNGTYPAVRMIAQGAAGLRVHAAAGTDPALEILSAGSGGIGITSVGAALNMFSSGGESLVIETSAEGYAAVKVSGGVAGASYIGGPAVLLQGGGASAAHRGGDGIEILGGKAGLGNGSGMAAVLVGGGIAADNANQAVLITADGAYSDGDYINGDFGGGLNASALTLTPSNNGAGKAVNATGPVNIVAAGADAVYVESDKNAMHLKSTDALGNYDSAALNLDATGANVDANALTAAARLGNGVQFTSTSFLAMLLSGASGVQINGANEAVIINGNTGDNAKDAVTVANSGTSGDVVKVVPNAAGKAANIQGQVAVVPTNPNDAALVLQGNGTGVGLDITGAAVALRVRGNSGDGGDPAAEILNMGTNGTALALSKAGTGLSLDALVEGSVGIIESLRLANAANGGKVNGGATTTEHVRDVNDTKNRVTATVDANGNRTAVTLDLS